MAREPASGSGPAAARCRLGTSGLAEFVDFLAASQLIFEALAEECGPERVAAVVNRLRRQSFDFG